MTHRDFAQKLGDRLGLDRDTAMAVCRAYSEVAIESLVEGQEVPLINLGKLHLAEVPPRYFNLSGRRSGPREGMSEGSTKLRFRPAVAFYRRFDRTTNKRLHVSIAEIMDR